MCLGAALQCPAVSDFSSLQNIEFHLRKLEELSDQTVSHLGVIHRFMATQGRDAPTLQTPFPFPSMGSTGSTQDVHVQGSPCVADNRLRRFSDRSELEGQRASETSGSANELNALGHAYPRRRPVR